MFSYFFSLNPAITFGLLFLAGLLVWLIVTLIRVLFEVSHTSLERASVAARDTRGIRPLIGALILVDVISLIPGGPLYAQFSVRIIIIAVASVNAFFLLIIGFRIAHVLLSKRRVRELMQHGSQEENRY